MYNVVSPWPPQRNGIADYAFELARFSPTPLSVVTRAARPAACAEGVTILNDGGQGERVLAKGPNIYHVGNNRDHVFLVPLFLRYPGVVVIHDTTLHYLAELTDAVLPGFVAAMLRIEQPTLADAFEHVWNASGMKRAIDHLELRLLGWLRDASRVVVHSHHAARAVAPYFPGTPVHVVPHFAYCRELSGAEIAERRASARKRLKIEKGEFVLSTPGFITTNKCYEATIRAVGRLGEAARRRVRYFVVGEERPDLCDVRRLAAEASMADRVAVTGYVARSELEDVLLASDLVLSLRYPTHGESSGVVARSLGLGCAVVVTDAGAYAELPGDVCFKVPSKRDPSREIADLVDTCMSSPGRATACRVAALDYAHSALDPAQLAARYAEIALAGGGAA